MHAQAAFDADRSPPCTKYTPSLERVSSMPRIPAANMDRDTRKRGSKVITEANPSPFDYKDKDEKWKVAMSSYDKVPNYSIPKVKEFRFWDKHLKSKKYLPGVGTHDAYKPETLDKISKGPSPRYKVGR